MHRPIPTRLPAASRLALVVACSFAASLTAPPRAVEFFGPEGQTSYQLGAGETHEGDLYGAAQTIEILGTQQGDLVGWAQTISVTGEVSGDLMTGSQNITVQGRVGDTARLFANTVVINGTIDGDLMVFAQTLTLTESSHVTGDVFFFGQLITAAGTVDGDLDTFGQKLNLTGEVNGDLKGTLGEVDIVGTVRSNVDVTCDTLNVDPRSRIEGDLRYTARDPLEDLESLGVVNGEIVYEKREKEEAEDEGLSWSWLWWRFFFLIASLIVGYVLIALFRRQTPAVERAVGEALPSLGVGFVIAIVLPVAAVIVCLLVVTIPLAIVTLMLYLIGWYIAKLPVALWIGRWILTAAGRTDPSPYLGLPIGLILLYAVFKIPFLGFFLYFATIFIGLGALFLGIRSQLRSKTAGATPPPSPPSTA